MKHIKIAALIVFLIASLTIAGQPAKQFTADTISDANPWSHLNMNKSKYSFQFLIVADRTGHHRPGIFADALQKINHLQPEFVMCVGDLIEGYTEETQQLNAEWDEFDAMVNKLEMPFFYLPGNHDIYDPNSLQVYERRRGRTYYHFLYKNVLFLCLNSEEAFSRQGSISDKQIAYFAKVLKKYSKAAWTCVLIHKPIWQKEAAGWEKFTHLLSERNHTVFGGHKHTYSKQKNPLSDLQLTSLTDISKDVIYYNLATTGGASELTGPQGGMFDHVMWVTFNGKGPRIANLSLSGIFGDDPPTESKPKDPNDLKIIATSPK